MAVMIPDMESKRLDHLHAIIERLAKNSFSLKGWAVTVASGFFGFAVKDAKPAIALVGLIPVTIFWITDGYYLMQERHFRILYNASLTEKQDPTFQITGLKVTAATWLAAIATPVLAGLYLTLCLCCFLIGIGLFVIS